MKTTIKAVCMWILSTSLACAAEYYVGMDGSNDGDGSEGAPFLTVDKAIQVAQSAEDVIYVKPGVYTTTTQWGPQLKARLVGLGESREDVVLQSGGAYRTLRTAMGSAIEHLTIVGNGDISKVDKGGAIEMSGGTVRDCVIRDGAAYGNSNRHCGGNLYLNASSIVVEDCVISGGRASKHGGNVVIDGGGTLRNCTIVGGVSGVNSTDEPQGGNVYLYKGVLENCVISGGQAERAGNVYMSHADARVVGCTVVDGSTTAHGGNVFMRNGMFSGCVITNGACAANNGGNVHMQGGVVTNSVIQGGRAGQNGGNVYMTGGVLTDSTVEDGYCGGTGWDQGGGNVLANPGRLTRCVVRRGSMTEGKNQGGGIRSRNAGTVIEDCLVVDNRNGGICLEGKGTHYNNTVVRNDYYGIFGYGSNPGTFVNCVVFGNVNPGTGMVNEWNGNKPAAADMSNCAFGSEVLAGTSIATWAGTLYLANDACFVDAANGDYHPAEFGVLVDAGAVDVRSDAPVVDLDGNSRTSGPVDMGCYEVQKQSMTVSLRYTEALPHLYVPVVASFTAAVEHAPSQHVTYECDFGDGVVVTSEEPAIAHEYVVPGVYTITIRAFSADAVAEMVYENYVSLGAAVQWVSLGATPVFPYDTLSTGHRTVAEALAVAVDGSEIRVADGVYEQTARIAVNKAVRIRGNDARPEAVVLRNVSEAAQGAGDRRVMSVEAEGAWVSGLTLEGGQVYKANGGNLNMTAGMVSNCVIRGGVAQAVEDGEFGMGAGVSLAGSGVVTHCVITNNEVRGCASGKWPGGGAVVFPWSSAGKLRHSLVAGNRWISGTGEGAPTRVVDPEDASVTNLVVNIVSGAAGLVYHGSTGGSVVENCTIVSNAIDGRCSEQSAAGVRCDWNSVIRNSVIANNWMLDSEECEDQPQPRRSNVHLMYAEDMWKDGLRSCVTEEALPSENATCFVAALSEMFRNVAEGDYRPATEGPLTDCGTEYAGVPEVDLAGRPRVAFDRIDIGCYEAQDRLGTILFFR